MNSRRHHNTDGRRQIARGKTRERARALARSLGVPYGREPKPCN
jgi:hypothetical protein